jgi:membrane protease YdiL (CAAX protease family)
MEFNEVIIMQEGKLSIKVIIISYIVFLSGWTFRVVCIDLSTLNEYVSWAIGFIIHAVWWLLFALFFIKRYDKDLKISFKEMVTTKPKLKILLPLLAFAIVYNLGLYFFNSNGFGTKMKLYDLIITVLTVGIFEESVFRGWFFNSIAHFTSERKANLISAALFLFIHYPSWISQGNDVLTIISKSIIIYVLGLIFGWAFRKNKSIWTGTIFHSFWDLITFII